MLYIYVLEISALVLEAAGLIVLLRLVGRLVRRIEGLWAQCGAQLDALASTIRQLTEDSDGDAPTESRRKAAEAERRFTEGVANILNFSYGAAGRKGE
ncbi:hypothetical protein SAMN02745823_02538 [Sporobacter termitidis DSM 10068]|uniref:Uncharacterized protein n=1 Tax=Sporobacter termitidis DSM 10068 TaxID=1123282 RepID=A0A1M5YHF7_9FIRM|nr:hypothetical protein [Sporobacter termitidis]SHI11426.1 hypothetical protein SAMN02745823_02538 [Sporobacter termitidis DSM 10068]